MKPSVKLINIKPSLMHTGFQRGGQTVTQGTPIGLLLSLTVNFSFISYTHDYPRIEELITTKPSLTVE